MQQPPFPPGSMRLHASKPFMLQILLAFDIVLPQSSAQKGSAAPLETSFNDKKLPYCCPINPSIPQPPCCPSRALRLSHVAVVQMLPLVVQPCKDPGWRSQKTSFRDSEYNHIYTIGCNVSLFFKHTLLLTHIYTNTSRHTWYLVAATCLCIYICIIINNNMCILHNIHMDSCWILTHVQLTCSSSGSTKEVPSLENPPHFEADSYDEC